MAQEICKRLPNAENKIWPRHPAWFLEGNPIVAYSRLKGGIRLMFWSGMNFQEKQLKPDTGDFKHVSIIYTYIEQIDKNALKR